jgi:aspartate kinase
LRAVAERMVAAQRSGRGVVAILSAMGSSTDELAEMAYKMSARPPLRELDALLSVGESVSVALASMAVAELGSHAVSLSGPQAGIRTDGQHGNERLREIRPVRIHDALARGAIVLVTGFQGMSEEGDVTTLGRGGSVRPRSLSRRPSARPSARSSPTYRRYSPLTRGSWRTRARSGRSATKRCSRWPRRAPG